MNRGVFFLVAVLLLLQVGVLPVVFSGGPVPEVLLAGVIWMLFHFRLRRSLLAGLSGGAILDIFSGLPVGSHLVSLLGATLLVHGVLALFIPKEKTLFVFSGSVVVGFVAHQLLLFMAAWLLHPASGGGGFEFELGRFLNLSSLLAVVVMLASVYGLELFSQAVISLRYEQKSF